METEFEAIGPNVRVKIEDGHLIVNMDLTRELGLSVSEASITVAGPLGRAGTKIPGTDYTLMLQLYKPNPKRHKYVDKSNW